MPLFLRPTPGRLAESLKRERTPPSPRRNPGRAGLTALAAFSQCLLRVLPGVCLMACGSLAADEAPSPQAAARAIRDGVNFRQPARSYVTMPSTWRLHVEKSLVEHHPERARSAVAKLEAALALVFKSLPNRPAATLASLDIYLLWGKNSPDGGRASGMSYLRKAQDQKLYQNVRDTKGRILSMAYACRNQLEYFAELSAMYFVGGNYLPFDKQGLQSYDPIGYAMVEQAWGLAK